MGDVKQELIWRNNKLRLVDLTFWNVTFYQASLLGRVSSWRRYSGYRYLPCATPGVSFIQSIQSYGANQQIVTQELCWKNDAQHSGCFIMPETRYNGSDSGRQSWADGGYLQMSCRAPPLLEPPLPSSEKQILYFASSREEIGPQSLVFRRHGQWQRFSTSLANLKVSQSIAKHRRASQSIARHRKESWKLGTRQQKEKREPNKKRKKTIIMTTITAIILAECLKIE